MRNLHIGELRAFHAVVDAGSVTAAASRLDVTQPTVSRLIASLERRVGFALFERAGRRLVLAAEGEAFHRETERFLSNAESLEEAARNLRGRSTLHTRIVSMPALAYGLLPQAMARVRDSTDRLAIIVDVRRRAEISRWIAGRQFDLGLASLPVDYPGIVARRLAVTHAYAVVPRGHRLARHTTISADALASEPLIGLTAEAVIQERLVRLFRRIGRSPEFSVKTSSLLAVCHFVAAGIGCGVVDPFTAHAARDLAIEVRHLQPGLTLHYGILWEKGRALPPRLERLATLLGEAASDVCEAVSRRASKR